MDREDLLLDALAEAFLLKRREQKAALGQYEVEKRERDEATAAKSKGTGGGGVAEGAQPKAGCASALKAAVNASDRGVGGGG